MKWPRRVLSTRGKVLPVAVFTIGAAFLFYSATLNDTVANASSLDTPAVVSAPAATFAGTGVGAIPDGTSPCWNPGVGAPRDVTFNATGLSGAPTAVDISMTFGSPAHSFVGDVVAVLIAPNGASHNVFGRTLSTTATAFGGSSDLAGPYIFSDVAPAPPSGGWWQQAALVPATMASGTYRTTASGGAGAVNPQPPTTMNSSFTGVANPNGNWILRLTDGCAADTGAISAATLSITAAPAVPVDANADFNGDSRTDYTVARGGNSAFAPEAIDLLPGRPNYSKLDERPVRTRKHQADAVPQAPNIFWWVQYNNTATSAVFEFGDAATDFITPEDFDGDGKDDLAVWTEAASTLANFKVFQSSTNTLATYTFGQTGDDPAVVGDYDGDGKADPAVYRCPGFADPPAQCYFFYRGSLNNPSGNITYVPWGFGVDGDFFPYVGDFDGDGKNDFNIQRANPANPPQGQFVMLKSGGGVEYINWGLSSDFLIPGDYDGDGKTDLCVRRTVSGARNHFVAFRSGGTLQLTWGVTGDSSVPGDYDGDGKTDFAIWRGSSTPGGSNFWILNSGSSSLTVRPWGQCPTVATCDFAVAGWAVH